MSKTKTDKKHHPKKLTVNAQTLRVLTSEQMGKIVGGKESQRSLVGSCAANM